MEVWLTEATRAAILLINGLALLIVVAGTIEAFISGAHVFLTSGTGRDGRIVWLRYARWLVAALTFQLAADILETSITTDWESVARVGAIAVIRTFVSYFLDRDVDEIRARQREGEGKPTAEVQAPSEAGV